MTRATFYRCIAERALAAGRPLGEALEKASAGLGLSADGKRAVTFARDGDIQAALKALGFESPTCRVASESLTAAAAVAAVDRRESERIPRKLLSVAMTFPAMLLGIEAFIIAFLAAYVVPVFQNAIGAFTRVSLAPAAWALGFAALGSAALWRLVFRRIERRQATQRMLARTAALVEAGITPARALALLSSGAANPDVAGFIHASNDHLSLARLAEARGLTSERAASAEAHLLGIVVSFLTVIPPALVVWTMYRAIALVPFAVFSGRLQ